MLDNDGVARHPFLSRIGPDILNPGLNWRTIAARLLSASFHRRSLAVLFLDQAFLAGVGNYLRSEILHQASIAPRHRPCDLQRKQVNALARSSLLISQRAYRQRGITNSPVRVRQLQNAV
ncbi:MAG: hypothetical protein R3F41_12480 [Gammaproteobacteria bacterium]|nr:hypothetical protein [Pseudomonadales bacterium]MCP5348914.1 hypothetical protein [Pseudomonadales bacterium]